VFEAVHTSAARPPSNVRDKSMHPSALLLAENVGKINSNSPVTISLKDVSISFGLIPQYCLVSASFVSILLDSNHVKTHR
jgi:hypothetical protein